MPKYETYREVLNNTIFSASWWWLVAIMMALITVLCAINKWVVHIPGFAEW